MNNLKSIIFDGISFEAMGEVAKLFGYGSQYWPWCTLHYDGTNHDGRLTIKITGRSDHSKEIPKMLLDVANTLNNR